MARTQSGDGHSWRDLQGILGVPEVCRAHRVLGPLLPLQARGGGPGVLRRRCQGEGVQSQQQQVTILSRPRGSPASGRACGGPDPGHKAQKQWVLIRRVCGSRPRPLQRLCASPRSPQPEKAGGRPLTSSFIRVSRSFLAALKMASVFLLQTVSSELVSE